MDIVIYNQNKSKIQTENTNRTKIFYYRYPAVVGRGETKPSGYEMDQMVEKKYKYNQADM